MRLDHFIAKNLPVSERSAKMLIASGEVCINGVVTTDNSLGIDRFKEVRCKGEVLQPKRDRVYIMLNKPEGYLSATTDPVHPVVLDLVDHPDKDQLHLAGRLDRSSTGLMLLTNDSEWSERLTRPDSDIEKVYLVETVDSIPDEAVEQFRKGFYFATEGITTKPADLEILSLRRARVTISEGKFHQVKRMFHRVNGSRLVSLHRERIGEYCLPDDLQPGEWRLLAG